VTAPWAPPTTAFLQQADHDGGCQGEFDLYFLYVMTFMKGLNLIFFLFPFIAIKWYLRGGR